MTCVTKYGIAPDINRDDIAGRLQRAIEKERVLEFPPGNYWISSVDFKPGQIFLGYGAVFRGIPNLSDWCQMFSCHDSNGQYDRSNPYYHVSPLDSETARFRGFTFNFQRHYQNDPEKPHQAAIGASAKGPGKVRIDVQDCKVTGSTADGIYIGRHCDARVRSCEFIDCERAAIVPVQDSRFDIASCQSRILEATMGQRKGLDVEPNRSSDDTRNPVQGVVRDFIMHSGGLDVMSSPGSRVVLDNVQVLEPYWMMSSLNASIDVRDCYLASSRQDDQNCRWTWPNGTVSGTRFHVVKGRSVPLPTPQPEVPLVTGTTPMVTGTSPAPPPPAESNRRYIHPALHLMWFKKDNVVRDQSLILCHNHFTYDHDAFSLADPSIPTVAVMLRNSDAEYKNVLKLFGNRYEDFHCLFWQDYAAFHNQTEVYPPIGEGKTKHYHTAEARVENWP